MKKLILAISGVFCLQLGFIIYHSNDPSAETSFVVVDSRGSDNLLTSKVPEPFDNDQIPFDLDLDSPTDNRESLEFDSSSPGQITYPAAISVRISNGRGYVRKRNELNTFVSLENPAALRPVNVIYKVHGGVEFKQYQTSKPRTEYLVAIPPEREAKKNELMAKPASRSKKKNIFARVIKKPYDWLKAFGSTFK